MNNPVRFIDISGFSPQEGNNDEQKKELVSFIQSFTSEFVSIMKNINTDKFGEAIVTLFNSEYMQVTVDLNQVDYFLSGLGLITDFKTFTDNWAESYLRAEAGELDSIEDFSAEVTALALNSAGDLAVGTVKFVTSPLRWTNKGFAEDFHVFNELLNSFEVNKDMVLNFASNVNDKISDVSQTVYNGWADSWDNIKWAWSDSEP